MNVVMDACSIINLHNGGVLRQVCAADGINIQVGPIVGGECSEDCAFVIANLHDEGELEYLSDTEIDSDEFLNFVAEHRLGDGEAECILLAELDEETVVCCDDMRGRKKAVERLGRQRLIGSIKLLKLAVESHVLEANEAYEAYQQMREAGGFLPDLELDYFFGEVNAEDAA